MPILSGIKNPLDYPPFFGAFLKDIYGLFQFAFNILIEPIHGNDLDRRHFFQ